VHYLTIKNTKSEKIDRNFVKTSVRKRMDGRKGWKIPSLNKKRDGMIF